MPDAMFFHVSAQVPASGAFFPRDNQDRDDLPDYRLTGNSPYNILTLTDCDAAIRCTIRQNRLWVFEIARRELSIVRRIFTQVELEGEAREFDACLCCTEDDFKHVLSIEVLEHLRKCRARLVSILQSSLLLDRDYKECEGTSSRC